MYAWPNYIHIFDGEYVIIIRLYMLIMNQSKDELLFDMHYCQCLIITTSVPLAFNISVQELDINVH